uniref:Uncharacterized protein n=1 Tax=Lotus japonicus TaxID=34305 RepID=I3SC73_LOTJA|nr:unknown [Lotus japonicus]
MFLPTLYNCEMFLSLPSGMNKTLAGKLPAQALLVNLCFSLFFVTPGIVC